MGAGGVIDVLAQRARLELDTCGAQQPAVSIGPQRPLDIGRILRHHVRQTDCVLHRHAGALRHVLEHGMGGIAEQCHAAVYPARRRLAVAEHPESPVTAVVDDLSRPLVHVREARHDLLLRYRHPGRRFGSLVLRGDHQIENLPA